MEVYKSETREILRRYLTGKIGWRVCSNALAAAAAGTIPRLKPEELPEFRALVAANDELVAKEHKRQSEIPGAKSLRTRLRTPGKPGR
jgi:hypothetical protein